MQAPGNPPVGATICDGPCGWHRREEIWREHDACRRGITNYDDHLYRIRSWSITLTTILVGGYFGINAQTKPGGPGIAILAIALISSFFWLLDGLSKSLQMVHIHTSRNLEAILRGEDVPYFGPMLGFAFDKKQERHLRPALKNLGDQSIWPFYVLPVFGSCIIIGLQSRLEAKCGAFEICAGSPDLAYGLVAVGSMVALLVGSWFSNDKFMRWSLIDGVRRYLLLLKCRRLFERAKRDNPSLNIVLQKRYISPFSANFTAGSEGKCLIFVDSMKTAEKRDYRPSRARLLKAAGFSLFSLCPDADHFEFESGDQGKDANETADEIKKKLSDEMGLKEGTSDPCGGVGATPISSVHAEEL